jgi:hypothetical protein
MKTYILACNLRQLGETYEALYDFLRREWAGVQIAHDVWLIQTELRSAGALERMSPLVGPNDSLVMIEVTKGADWATREGPSGGLRVLTKRLSSKTVPA